MADQDGGGWLYVLGRLATRLVQAALVIAGVGLAFYVVNPDRGYTVEKAYIASMKADLRNLVTAQEAYFADNETYTSMIGNLAYAQSSGNTVTIGSANGTGWAATAKSDHTTTTCGIFVASAPPERTHVLSWSASVAERHDLFRASPLTWIEAWPGHEERFHVKGRTVALASTGTLLGVEWDPSLELFVRDRGQPLRSVLGREDGGPWQFLGKVVAGSESRPSGGTSEGRTLVLSWSANPAERHDLFLYDAHGDSTWIEVWPGHEENFRVAGRDVALASTGTRLREERDPPRELFVRDRGQPLSRVLWRESLGPWHTLGVILPGSEPVPARDTAEAAPQRMAPPWAGAQEGVPLCWKG